MSELKDLSIANSTKLIDTSSLYLQLQNLGCCKICTLRFLGETCPGPYTNVQEALKNVGKSSVLIKKKKKMLHASSKDLNLTYLVMIVMCEP